ncbi:MAG: twin-arginine translocase TatA/TatE family subunit [Propionibacteriaceae bacterium]|nr:twin-arginine translocase TatA/TatE family subunit [Propionibacteriaceae bacterium]
MPSMGGWEWVILALIALLLFGGSRLAGIGKSTGKAIREFKEETASLRSTPAEPVPPVTTTPPQAASPVDPEPNTDAKT